MKLINVQLFIIISMASVVSSGVISLLILTLNLATIAHQNYPILLYMLPFVAIATTHLYKNFASKFQGGMSRVFEEIHHPQMVFPKRMAPMMFVCTCLSHLVGASVGREGAALLIGVSFSDRFSSILKLDREARKTLLMSLLAASFSTVVNSPLGGLFFALESMYSVSTFFSRRTVYLICASLVGYSTRQFFPFPIEKTFYLDSFQYSFKLVLGLLLFAILLGIFVRIFLFCLEYGIRLLNKKFPHSYLRSFVLSLLLVSLLSSPAFFPSKGLGIFYIEDFLSGHPQSLERLATKFIATLLSLFAELKGGEFVPMVYMGSLFGNLFGQYANLSPILFAMMGYVGMFAGAAHAPLAMAVTALSIFGIHAFFPALIVCIVCNFFSGRVSVYHQRSYSIFKLLNTNGS